MCTIRVVQGAVSSLPETGPSVVVANHPFGGIEGVALADLLLERRSDVKVLTNELLCRIPEFKDVFIGVDVLTANAREKNKIAIAEAKQWVSDGHQLLIFPAGEVSSYNRELGGISDPHWHTTAATIALNADAQVTPIFIDGTNSRLFHWFGRIHPRLRTLRLVKELMNKQGSTLQFRIARTLDHKELTSFSSKTALTQYLRLCTYLMSPNQGETKESQPVKPLRAEESIADEVSTIAMEAEIDRLPKEALVLEKGEMAVFCVEANDIPFILKEIGRLREITFREVGEGSGRSLDYRSLRSVLPPFIFVESGKNRSGGRLPHWPGRTDPQRTRSSRSVFTKFVQLSRWIRS